MSIGKGSLLNLATDLVVFGLGIILSIVLTRSLGATWRGVYTILTSLTLLLTAAAGLSIGTACSTFLAQGRYQAAEVQTVVVALALGLGVLAGVAVTAIYPLTQHTFFQDVPYEYVLVALIGVPVGIYQGYWSAIMVGLGRLTALNGLNLVTNLSSTAAMLLLVGLLGWGLPGFLLAWVSGWVVWLAGSLVVSRGLGGFAWPPRRAVAADLVHFGLRGHGANVASQLFLNFDIYVVQTLLGLVPLGIYSLAVQLAKKLWLPINAVGAAATSKISGLPPAESALLTAKVARGSILITGLLAVPLAIISPWLIPFIYTPAFSGAVLPLIILLFGAGGYAVSQVLSLYITGRMERPGLLSLLSWAELAISLPLYLGFILWQGIVGAAIASTLTYILTVVGAGIIFRRHSGLPWSAFLVPRMSDLDDYFRVLRAARDRVSALLRPAA